MTELYSVGGRGARARGAGAAGREGGILMRTILRDAASGSICPAHARRVPRGQACCINLTNQLLPIGTIIELIPLI